MRECVIFAAIFFGTGLCWKSGVAILTGRLDDRAAETKRMGQAYSECPSPLLWWRSLLS